MLIGYLVSQVKHEEVTGPEAEAAIAQITQQPPTAPQEGSSSDPHASKPTTSALAEHDAAFPAIGAMNGTAGPGKSPAAVNGGTSVVATLGDDSAYAPGALDNLETAPSSVSVCLTVGDEGEDVLVALTLDGAQRYALEVLPGPALPCHALPCPALPCLSLPCLSLPCLPCPCGLALPCFALPGLAWPCLAMPCRALPCLALPCLAHLTLLWLPADQVICCMWCVLSMMCSPSYCLTFRSHCILLHNCQS